MFVQLGAWPPEDLQNDDGLYSEKELEAMVVQIKNKEDKRILEEILTDLRAAHPKKRRR